MAVSDGLNGLHFNYAKVLELPTTRRQMSTTTSTMDNASKSISNETMDGGDKSSSTKNEKKDEKEKKGDENIFLDNLGKIFFGVIAAIVLALVRSSRGTSNRTNLREEMENNSLLDPSEIDDLRFANSEFTPEVFRTIAQNVIASFPSGKASYEEFVSVVLSTMRALKGEQFTIELGHFLDRVVIGYIQNQTNAEWLDKSSMTMDPLNHQLPLPLLFTILSLAMNSSVSERIQTLFDTLSFDKNNATEENTLSEQSIESMIGYLQMTCQLPPDPQILTSDVKYPVQEYKVGVPEELLAFAKKEVSDKGDIVLLGKERFDRNDFEAILCSGYVCAWGECYGRSKK